MNDLYKAIDSLKDIIAEEQKLSEKLKPFKGSYNNKTEKIVKIGDKQFVAPKDYKSPLSKTTPSARPVIDFLNNLGKKVSDKGKELDPFFKEPKQNTKVDKKEPVTKSKSGVEKVTKKELPPIDIMGAGTKRKDKIKATAANTKNYDSTLALQKSLIAKGAKIDADGIMGPQTRAAMKQFGQPDAMPTPRPKTTPKSGGPDKRFITGPELDLPNKNMPPEFKRLPKVIEPDNRFKDFDPRMPNRYVKNKSGDYNLAQGPNQPDKKIGDDFIDKIAKSFGDYKLGDIAKNIYNYAGQNKAKPNVDPLKLAQPKSDNTTKVANKNMIKRITGANT